MNERSSRVYQYASQRMSQQEQAVRAIEAKWQQLGAQWGDLGAPQGSLVELGGGGWCRAYQYGLIYWQPATGAHAVHGGILNKYLSRGGHAVNPATGRRELGYPASDELRTDDDRYPVSYFEGGAIYGLNGGVALFGEPFLAWKATGGERGRLGYPITDPIVSEGLEVGFFQQGCLVCFPGTNGFAVGVLKAPPLGQPGIVDPGEGGPLPVKVTFELRRDEWDRLDRDASRLAAIWQGRLVLQPVGPAAPVVPLVVEVEPGGSQGVALGSPFGRLRVDLTCTAGTAGRLLDRTLYDVSFRQPDGGGYTLAPHAIYARKAWDNFELIRSGKLPVSHLVEGARRGEMDSTRSSLFQRARDPAVGSPRNLAPNPATGPAFRRLRQEPWSRFEPA